MNREASHFETIIYNMYMYMMNQSFMFLALISMEKFHFVHLDRKREHLSSIQNCAVMSVM